MKSGFLKPDSMMVALIAFSSLTMSLPVRAQDPYVGEIRMFGFSFCPATWLEADGRLLSVNEFMELYALYGNTYGGNGRTNFALPDLRGRVPIGEGRAPGLSPYRQGDKGGQETVVLSVQQMPAHNHGVMGNQGTGENKQAVSIGGEEGGEVLDQPVQKSGEAYPHENRPPFLVMRYCVATRGTFPPRE